MDTKEKKDCKLLSNEPVVDEQAYGDTACHIHEKVADKYVYNIGIIASYGAGKSSLIKTYQHKYPKEKTITISLANFNDTSIIGDEGKDSTSENDGEHHSAHIRDVECAVEKSILQQLIFHVKKSKVPDSRLKGIDYNHRRFTILFSVFLVVLVSSIFLTVLEFKQLLPFSDGNNFYYFFGACVVAAFFLILICINNYKIGKIKVNDIEASFCGEDSGSILNTFLDEIIYYFYKTKISVVFIEDLERFNNLNIFYKLRELNFILNNTDIIRRKVTFIYAVKDTLFNTETDRAKFFEFIMPLMPVLNSENAKDILKTELEQFPGELQLSDTFISEISQFIQDKRVLNNILNDYRIYFKKLNFSRIDDEDKAEKLFSLMVYKNLRPNDFADLQTGAGKLLKIFRKKRDLIKEKCDEIEKSQLNVANADKIQEYRQKKRELINISLKQYIAEYGFDLEEKDELLRYLLVNGYVTENYIDYILPDGERLITFNDKKFIRNVLAKKEIDYNYRLDNSELVIHEIQLQRFADKYVLNFDLVNYLLCSDNRYLDKRNNLVAFLVSSDDCANNFIIEYIINNNISDTFIDCLVDKSYPLSSLVLGSSAIPVSKKHDYLICLFNSSNMATLKMQNSDGVLLSYLEKLTDIIDLIAKYCSDKFIEFMDNIHGKIDDMRCSEEAYDICKQLVEHSNYTINSDNITFILFKLYGLNDETYQYALFDAILDSNIHTLIDYCQNNLNDTLSVLLSFDKCCESQKAVEIILKATTLSSDVKMAFIEKLETKTDLTNGLAKEVVKRLVDLNKINGSWSNVVNAVTAYSIEPGIIQKFIESNCVDLTKEPIDNKSCILYICNKAYNADSDLTIFTKLSSAFNIKLMASDITFDKVCSVLIKNNIIEPIESNLRLCSGKLNSAAEILSANESLIGKLKTLGFSINLVIKIINCATVELALKLLNYFEKDIISNESNVLAVLPKLLELKNESYPKSMFKALICSSKVPNKNKVTLISNYKGEIIGGEIVEWLRPFDDVINKLHEDEISVRRENISALTECLAAKGIISIEKFKEYCRIKIIPYN